MTARLTAIARAALDPVTLVGASPRRVGQLISHKGHMLEASGCPYPIGSAVSIGAASGANVSGEIIGFRGSVSLIQPLSTGAVATGGADSD